MTTTSTKAHPTAVQPGHSDARALERTTAGLGCPRPVDCRRHARAPQSDGCGLAEGLVGKEDHRAWVTNGRSRVDQWLASREP
jgi:hypothetical protein